MSTKEKIHYQLAFLFALSMMACTSTDINRQKVVIERKENIVFHRGKSVQLRSTERSTENINIDANETGFTNIDDHTQINDEKIDLGSRNTHMASSTDYKNEDEQITRYEAAPPHHLNNHEEGNVLNSGENNEKYGHYINDGQSEITQRDIKEGGQNNGTQKASTSAEEFDSITEMKNEGTPPTTMAQNNGLGYGFLTSTPLNSPNLIWPVKGAVIKRFSKRKENYSDGISIAVAMNTPVTAASNGEILFAGDTDKYGKIVIIKHDNELMTAYAHNNILMVRKGDFVKKGDIIARSGKTGMVSVPQLYFSVKYQKITVNPEAPLQ